MRHTLMISMLVSLVACAAIPDASPPPVTAEVSEPVVVSGLPGDIPLMPSMDVGDAEVLVFDSPAGRIADITLSSPSSVNDSALFYAENLVSMGWQPVADNRWQREDESLSLTLQPAGRGSMLLFHLEPAAAP